MTRTDSAGRSPLTPINNKNNRGYNMHQSAPAALKYPAPGDVYSSRLNPGEICKVVQLTDGHVTYRWLGEDSHSLIHTTPLAYFIRYFAVKLYAVQATAPSTADDAHATVPLDQGHACGLATDGALPEATHSPGRAENPMGATGGHAPQAPFAGGDPHKIWHT